MPVPIFLYHQIDVPPQHRTPYRSMIVHPDRFRQQMAWLKRLGYRGLSVRDAIPYIYGGKQGKVAVITFDDGSRMCSVMPCPCCRSLASSDKAGA